jgi:hypothetical protein
MTFFDFLKDLIDSGKERLKTPITGAFVFSFLVWNWRPIAVLFFSDAPIGDKIVVVNHEYCTIGAIIFPVFIALFYTLLIPKIMVKINKELAPTKNKRLDDIYDTKEHITDRKIQLAEKEYRLKNVESGSKQIDELQNQIKSLEESNTQIINANKNAVEQLNTKLKEVNEIIKSKNDNAQEISLKSIRNNRRDYGGYIEDILIPKFSKIEIKQIKDLIVNGKLNTSYLSEQLSKKLVVLDLMAARNTKMMLTDLGEKFITLI